ncbi:biotin-[acetyl-CoA-carboxylase] ligase [Pontimonas salivibrio]|uniref:biotin--[biotin carboxyl-carrier protein] ligase n=1 Tax=Pontimonas salivibrio TaxID=1159327 RepID=A0A2L2BSE2_9MICO|nr:biotin--[acetyl-CoA-carboxylase] ligase [Pontimonas salivibrio]AVG24579.1 biotin-[acetyl-CoA-carboxylase] ligase [Pontimonas salivibrio]
MWPEHPAPLDLANLADEVQWLDSSESTNTHLAGLPAPSGTRLAATWNQTAGVGRMGRTWISPPGKCLALSVELGPQLTPKDMTGQWRGLLPLLVGAHLAQALSTVVSGVTVKWPNDVQINGKKVAGILGEMPAPGRVIVGVGINVGLEDTELPTEQATSLFLHDVEHHDGSEHHEVAHCESAPEETFSEVVRVFLSGLTASLSRATIAIPGPLWSMVRDLVSTIGQEVRVTFPGGREMIGTAVDLDQYGRLIVRTSAGATEVVAAADIEHLRPA